MNRKVSVIIPVIRPERIPDLEKQVIDRAGIPRADIEILTMEDTDRVGAPKMVKTLVQMASHNLVLYLGDDCEPQQNFILCALKAMKKHNGNWGLVGLNCGRWVEPGKQWESFLDHGEVAQHWLAHKKLLRDLGGEFFHTGYQHCFCDNELTQRCKEMGRYVFSQKSRIVHHHPIVMGDDSLWNDDLKRVYSDQVYLADKRLFESRQRNGWKTQEISEKKRREVVILVPIYGQGKHRFWSCLSESRFTALKDGIDTILKKKSSADIAHCRNMLVSENLKQFPDAEYFLFLDVDQTFPQDLIGRLLEHDKDIVTVNVYRKGHGFFPVVSFQGDDDDFFRPVHVIPKDGKLRRVTSAGTGIVMIKRRVFEGISFPWFKSEYIDPVGDDKEDAGLIEGKIFVSEDNRFYVIATSLGFKLYCDFSIEIGHIGDKEYTWKDHENYLKENPDLIEDQDGKRKQADDEGADTVSGGIRDRLDDKSGDKGRLQAAPTAA